MKINATTFGPCIARIAEKGEISKNDALDLLNEVARRSEKMRATGVADPHVAAAGALAEELKASARADRVDALRNALVRKNVLDRVEQAGGLARAAGVLRGLLHGTNKDGRDSIESMWRGNASGWQAQLSFALRKAGVEKAAIDGGIDRDVARELWAMNAGKPSGAAANGPARAIAEAVQPLLDHVRDRLNGAGARIGDAVEYVTHTLHDPAKMRRAAGPGATPEQAFDAWWKVTEPRLSQKTFENVEPGPAARRDFGKSVFDALVSGVHMTPDGAFGLQAKAGQAPRAYEGTSNLAKKLGQKRVLLWKDADAWHAHMQDFGAPHSLVEGVMMTLDKSARQLALLEKLGTNPTGNFNTIVRRIQETYRDDLDGVKKFQSKIGGLEAVMAHLDGSANIPQNEMWARLGSAMRTWESVSSLGSVGVTHFASIWPTVTSEMVHHGESRLGTLGKMIAALVKGRGSEERQEVMAQLGAYSDGLSREMFSRWQPEDGVPGRLSAMASTFFKYTGVHYVFDNTQAAVREMLANHLARNAGTEFARLDPHLAQMLGKYGIGATEWDMLRKVGGFQTVGGHAYMTPRDALRIDPAAAESYLRANGAIAKDAKPDAIARAVARLGASLSDKLYSYYGDAAAHSVITPGVKERALVLGQERPGSLGGELRRFVAQFKMWPIAAASQVLGRDIHMSLTRGEVAWNLGTLAALTTAAGYLRMSVSDVATGRPIRNPLDPRTLMAALAQGGGIGILGDFLFGETNRMGGGLWTTMLGPVAGDADKLKKIYDRFRGDVASGDPKAFEHMWPDLAHFGVQHIPFANLVYLKGTLDYLLWYHLYEAASPGWWERTNRRLARETGRTMTGYTPGGSIPWTPMGLGSRTQSPPDGRAIQQPTIEGGGP